MISYIWWLLYQRLTSILKGIYCHQIAVISGINTAEWAWESTALGLSCWCCYYHVVWLRALLAPCKNAPHIRAGWWASPHKRNCIVIGYRCREVSLTVNSQANYFGYIKKCSYENLGGQNVTTITSGGDKPHPIISVKVFNKPVERGNQVSSEHWPICQWYFSPCCDINLVLTQMEEQHGRGTCLSLETFCWTTDLLQFDNGGWYNCFSIKEFWLSKLKLFKRRSSFEHISM